MPTEEFVLALAKGFIEPVGRRNAFTMSRLAVREDGTTTPVLLLLADRKFGPEKLPEDKFPFWTDGNYRNELLSNVELATRPSAPSTLQRKSSYGVPSGTPEYMKAWQKANPEKVREARKRFMARRRAVLQGVQAEVAKAEATQPPVAADVVLDEDDVETDPVLARLEELLGTSASLPPSGDSSDENE